MITGLFETHLNVSDLERSTAFYRDRLGLELAHHEPERRVTFFWLGPRGEAMLGLWERPAEEVAPQHFAFRSTVEDIRQRANAWLAERELPPHNFLNDGTDRPMVFAWMPAISLYFTDPDDHLLELIAMLDDPPRPEAGMVSWEAWQALQRPADSAADTSGQP